MRTSPALRLSRRRLLAALPAFALGPPALAQVATPPVEPPVIAPPPPPPPPPPPVPIPPLDPAQLALAIDTLNAAETHGLAVRRIAPDAANEEVTTALVRYAKELHVGRLVEADFLDAWGVRPPAFDPRPGLAAAVTTGKLQPWLDSLAPPYAGYHALRRGLATYRAIAAKGGWDNVPAGADFGLGNKGPRTAALRARLAAEDKQVEAKGSSAFDEGLQKALARAQRRFGLQPNGVVNAQTLAALNQPVGQRILQIIANMERWRWLPPTMPATRVQVNSGAAIVTLFRDDRAMLSMRAVSGKAGDETPMLFSEIHSVVLNPPWNVPTSIATKELFPKERKNPGYFARNGFVVIRSEDGGVRLQQKAGSQSALGRYKFDFINPYGVYLHDTPTQSTFGRFVRQESHGCVRLEKPRELAEVLLSGNPEWTPETIAAAIEKGQTIRARLLAPVPVFIFYWTAFASPDGTMNFRSDPYNWDSLLLQRIGVLGGTPA